MVVWAIGGGAVQTCFANGAADEEQENAEAVLVREWEEETGAATVLTDAMPTEYSVMTKWCS